MSRPRKRKAFCKPDQPLPALLWITAVGGEARRRTRASYTSPSNGPMVGGLHSGKETAQLTGPRLVRGGPVNQLLLDLQAVVAADRARLGGDRVGRAHQGADGGDRGGAPERPRQQRARRGGGGRRGGG